MRTLGVVTAARSDYGIYRPLLRRIAADPDLRLRLYVTGSHLWPHLGSTVREIEADGFPVAARLEIPFVSDEPEGVAANLAGGVAAFAREFAASRPEILVILGDRYDMAAAAIAALPFKLPVAHLHGGELSAGAIDDALRHCLTKLSHLHFVSTADAARRVRQLGEEPWRVKVCGALGLDNLREVALLPPAELRRRWDIDAEGPFLLVTFHPATLDYENAEGQADELLAALAESGLRAVFTLPNADTRGSAVAARLRAFVAGRPADRLVDNFGLQGYFSVMARASAMVGNSSSGLLEAPSFRLPVVNVGDRQAGRLRAANVIDVPCARGPVARAIRKAVSPRFRASLRRLRNPYDRGGAAGLVLKTLKAATLDRELLVKRFADLAGKGRG